MTRVQRILAAVITATLLTGVVAAGWAAGARRGSSVSGQPVGTPDGRLRFVAPAGWVISGCRYTETECVALTPPGSGEEDTIEVGFQAGKGESGAFPPALMMIPIGAPDDFLPDRVTIAGVPGWRVDAPDLQPAVAILGELPGSDYDYFTIYCVYEQRERAIRAGCDLVLRSLQVVPTAPTTPGPSSTS